MTRTQRVYKLIAILREEGPCDCDYLTSYFQVSRRTLRDDFDLIRREPFYIKVRRRTMYDVIEEGTPAK